MRLSRQNLARVRSLPCVASLTLLSLLIAGCAGYTQKTTTQSPALSLSATSFNFQTVVVGQKSTQTIAISNSGTAPLQISSASISNNQFTFTGPSLPQSIPPAGSLSYTLTFAPTATGNVSGTLSISSNAGSTPASVSLVGSGENASASLTVTPSVVSFGNIALKTISTQNVTLQNTGGLSLSIQGVTVSGAGFAFSNLSPGLTLAPNQTVTFQVSFTPTVAGPASATLTLLSANLSSPQTLSMSGDGVSSTSPPPAPSPTPTQPTVTLTWNASTSQVIGYRVYRSETSGGPYNPLFGTAINALTYTDSTVSPGTTYYYVVTSVDAAGDESTYSNQVTAVIPAS